MDWRDYRVLLGEKVLGLFWTEEEAIAAARASRALRGGARLRVMCGPRVCAEIGPEDAQHSGRPYQSVVTVNDGAITKTSRFRTFEEAYAVAAHERWLWLLRGAWVAEAEVRLGDQVVERVRPGG